MTEKETKTGREDVTIAVRSNTADRDRWQALQAEHPGLLAADLFNAMLNAYAEDAFISAQCPDMQANIETFNGHAEGMKQMFAACIAGYNSAEERAEDKAKTKIAALSETIERQKADIEALKATIKDAESKDEEIAALNQQIAAKDAVIASKDDTIADKVAIIESHANLESQLGEALEDTRKLRERIDGLTEQVAAERQAAKEQEAKADAAVNDLRVSEAQADGLRTQIANLEAALTKAEAATEKAEAKAAAEAEKADERIAKAEADMANIRQQLDSAAKTYEDRIAVLDEQIAAKNTKIIELLEEQAKAAAAAKKVGK